MHRGALARSSCKTSMGNINVQHQCASCEKRSNGVLYAESDDHDCTSIWNMVTSAEQHYGRSTRSTCLLNLPARLGRQIDCLLEQFLWKLQCGNSSRNYSARMVRSYATCFRTSRTCKVAVAPTGC